MSATVVTAEANDNKSVFQIGHDVDMPLEDLRPAGISNKA